MPLSLDDKTALDGRNDFEAEKASQGITNGRYEQKMPAVEDVRDGSLETSTTEYLGPQGIGWEIVQKFTKNGETYTKVTGEGPESADRNHDWQLVEQI
jgi:hypothetical protein